DSGGAVPGAHSLLLGQDRNRTPGRSPEALGSFGRCQDLQLHVTGLCRIPQFPGVFALKPLDWGGGLSFGSEALPGSLAGEVTIPGHTSPALAAVLDPTPISQSE